MHKQAHYVYTFWTDSYEVSHMVFSSGAHEVKSSGARGLAVREAKSLQRDVLVFCDGRLVASGKYDVSTDKAAGRAI